jgi:hypothetical protein
MFSYTKYLATLFLIIAFNFNVKGQNEVYKYKDVGVLLSAYKSDSIALIERLVAYFFHEKLNVYRISKGRGVLLWSDELWLVSRNHCVWMASQNNLSHEERGGVFFTGFDPGNRIAYCNSKSIFHWTGENIFYTTDSWYGTVDETAKELALEAFEMWKESSGHNKNMLRIEAKVQGAAFYLKDGVMWATELLAGDELSPLEGEFVNPLTEYEPLEKKKSLVGVEKK